MASQPPLPEALHDSFPAPTRAWTVMVIFAVSLGFVMAMLDVTVVNVALIDIQNEFHTRLATLVWTVDAYTLTYAALLLLGGAFADRVGAKRAYMIGLIWFIVASALCGAAGSAPMLIAARLLQGAGAALFVPSSLSLLTESFPDRTTRTRLLGIWGAIIAAAAGAGPLVGGIFISLMGWRSIFFLNVPIGILGVVLALFVLRASPKKSHPFDFPTHGLIMVGLAGLSFALIEGPSFGWLSARILGAAAIAVGAALSVVLRERHMPHPVIPRSLACSRRFWALNGMGFLVNFVLFGEIFVVSLYLQKALGETALLTGLKMLPMMCMISIMNFKSGFLTVRWGVRRVLVIGFADCALGAALATIVGGGTLFWPLALMVALCNAGVGLAIPAVINGVMHEAGNKDVNVGAAALNANRQIGALAGVAAVGIVLHLVPAWESSIRLVFLGFTACALAALLLVGRVLTAVD